MYFKDEYNEYYDALAGSKDGMDTALIGMQETIGEVNNQFNSVELMISELYGDYADEMANTIGSLKEKIKALMIVVNTSLPAVFDTMNDLGEKLDEFKPKDERLDVVNDSYNTESKRSISRYRQDEEGNNVETDEYKNWKYNLNELKEELDELVEICKKFQEGCDSDINLINAFNNSVTDLRLKMVAVVTTLGSDKIEDVDSMTPKEKKEYLAKLAVQITEKYNQYKSMYEYYTKGYIEENCTPDELSIFYGMYAELMGDKDVPDLDTVLKSSNGVTRGNAIIDMLEALNNPENGVNGKTILEVFEAYKETGSWEESGMDELYKKNASYLAQEALRWGEDPEELFWSRSMYAPDEMDLNKIDSFMKVVDVLSVAKDNFNENYSNAINTAMIIKGIRGLEDSILYDYTFQKPDYAEYNPNVDVLYEYGIFPDEYTTDEVKMISYLVENNGIESALEYIDSKADVVNRRNGIINARNYYESLHSGNNEGIDQVWDHIRVDAKGLGDGLYSFTDGLIDLIAPDKQMSTYDYETVEFLNLLNTSDDPYDKELLRGYNICNTVGSYAIPTIANVVAPGSNIGTYMFIASDIGNGIESKMQANYQQMKSYDSDVLEMESYATSLLQTVVPYVGTDVPNDLFQAALGAVSDVNPYVGALIDVTFDYVYKSGLDRL